MRATRLHCTERATGTILIRFTGVLLTITDIYDAPASTCTFTIEETETILIVSARRECSTASSRVIACPRL
jgi:hypothetical protein